MTSDDADTVPDAPSDPVRFPLWRELGSADRHNPKTLRRQDIPVTLGVYGWFRDGVPVYAGRAKGRDGLRGRLSVHLSTGPDLSRSTFRSWVAVSVLDVPRPVTRQRPTVMTEEQVAQVNAWITSCYVGWVEKPTVAATIAFEEALLREWKPRLNHD